MSDYISSKPDAEHDVTVRAQEPAGTVVWDLPVRLFHWSLVILVGLAWWTAEQRLLDWHRLCGYSLLTLLLFRLAWGVVGSRPARFSSFVMGPGMVLTYLRGSYSYHPESGHNPLGGWSAVALLSILLIQVLLGLVAVDIDGWESGPLSWMVDFETGRWASETHAAIFDVLLLLIGLHLIAVTYYTMVRRKPLLRRMVTGVAVGEADRAGRFSGVARALFVLTASAGATYVLVSLLGR